MTKFFLPLLLPSFLFLYTTSLSGQRTSKKALVKWSPELKESKKSSMIDIVGYDEESVYALFGDFSIINRSPQLKIIKFNHNLFPKVAGELDLKLENKYLDYEFIYQNTSGRYLFTSLVDKRTNMNRLFSQSFKKME
jgi:hypothetical protein